MTKKDYIAIGDMFRKWKPQDGNQARKDQWVCMANEFVNLAARDNPRFDVNRWLGYITFQNGGMK